MSKLILASTALCMVASSAVAQSNIYIPSNTPTTGTCNVIPFGTTKTSTTWANQIYQTLAKPADLGNAQTLQICDMGFSPCGSGYYEFDTIEIVMGQTSATSLSTTFATNLVSNVKTVLKATNYKWHVTAGQWNRIGFDKDYTYIAALGGSLVTQITVTGNNLVGSGSGFHRSNTQERAYSYGWTGTPPTTGTAGSIAALKYELVIQNSSLEAFGIGCAGSNGTPTLSLGGSAALGGTVGIQVDNCVANAVALHVFGVVRFEPGVDLGFAGAPGCTLYETPDFIIGAVANASGTYAMKVGVPKLKNLICARVYTQGFPSDAKANKWGRTASNYGRILAGAN